MALLIEDVLTVLIEDVLTVLIEDVLTVLIEDVIVSTCPVLMAIAASLASDQNAKHPILAL